MTRYLSVIRAGALLVVLTLAGLPAARLVCDLACGAAPDARAAAPAGCHEHGPRTEGDALSSGAGDACHLLVVLPTLVTGSTGLLLAPADTTPPPAGLDRRASVAARAPHARWFSPGSPSTPTPLRI